MRVIVVFTSIEGTIAALTTAASLARNLAAEIVVHVSYVVYFRYPLECPPVSPAYFEKLCQALIRESDLDPNAIDIHIHCCRNQVTSLRQTLGQRSLVVLGMEKSWRDKREKKTAATLTQLGHDVVLVYAAPDPKKPHTSSVIQQMLR